MHGPAFSIRLPPPSRTAYRARSGQTTFLSAILPRQHRSPFGGRLPTHPAQGASPLGLFDAGKLKNPAYSLRCTSDTARKNSIKNGPPVHPQRPVNLLRSREESISLGPRYSRPNNLQGGLSCRWLAQRGCLNARRRSFLQKIPSSDCQYRSINQKLSYSDSSRGRNS